VSGGATWRFLGLAGPSARPAPEATASAQQSKEVQVAGGKQLPLLTAIPEVKYLPFLAYIHFRS